MKIYSLFLCVICCSGSFAQDTTIAISVSKPQEAKQEKVFQVVEEMPAFPGGEEAMIKFIQKNLQYPEKERENDIQGRVVVGFVVELDGSVTDIVIKKSVTKGLDDEAMRVVGLFPKFKPGKQQGKIVRVSYVLPIMFRLASPEPDKNSKKQ